jgi:uncharacterized protein YbjT (DUF2867 family)
MLDHAGARRLLSPNGCTGHAPATRTAQPILDGMRIIVVGASGYIGARLVPLLARRGAEISVLGRDPASLSARCPGVRVHGADLLEPASLRDTMDGVGVAYYLAHSLAAGRGHFADRDMRAAAAFGEAAREAGVGRIIYLGGLGADGPGLSPHLASRHEVGAELARHGVPVTEFRAAVVIGAGSASFEILRHLTERLPVMITPRWVSTRCQPIGIRDVLAYLVAALDHPDVTGVVEIGGTDVLSYGEMMMRYARRRGLRRLMIPVPVLTPALSSYWVNLISPVPAAVARPLIEGLRNEVLVRDPAPARRLGVQPDSYDEALAAAIDRSSGAELESTWFDAHRTPEAASLRGSGAREGMIIDRQVQRVEAAPERVFDAVERLGGATGWPYANVLWRMRGIADRLVGGVGMRLGRRDPHRLRVGDALDFWRVEEIRRPGLVRLRAEMRVPGRAWLQYEVLGDGRGATRLVQTAFFEPKGLPGLAYWYVLYPAHAVIFRGMVRALARRASAPAS